MPTLAPDRLTRANRDHRCDLCGLRIRRGATYYVREGAKGREHWRLRMHAVCRDRVADYDDIDWECWRPRVYEHDFRHDYLGLTAACLLSLAVEILGRRP
jgi:hypothetical protein